MKRVDKYIVHTILTPCPKAEGILIPQLYVLSKCPYTIDRDLRRQCQDVCSANVHALQTVTWGDSAKMWTGLRQRKAMERICLYQDVQPLCLTLQATSKCLETLLSAAVAIIPQYKMTQRVYNEPHIPKLYCSTNTGIWYPMLPLPQVFSTYPMSRFPQVFSTCSFTGYCWRWGRPGNEAIVTQVWKVAYVER